MSISGINSGASPTPARASSVEDAKIRVLEQRLQQLVKEKAKSEKAQDVENVKKIDDQIREIKLQIEELKRNESNKRESGQKASHTQSKKVKHITYDGHVNELI